MFRIGYACDGLSFALAFLCVIFCWNALSVLVWAAVSKDRCCVRSACAACCACSSLIWVVLKDWTAIPLSRNQSAANASSLKFL